MNSRLSKVVQHRAFIPVFLGISILFQIIIALRVQVNWDEFFRLGWIYEFKAGVLAQPLETGYIHGFRWLNAISDNEVIQIIAARIVMTACLCASCFCLFRIARRVTDRECALLAVLAFLTFSFVLHHGTAFRVDPPIIALLMAALCLLSQDRISMHHFIIAGLCIGIAGVISVKSIFYLPTIIILLFLHWKGSGWSKKILFHCILSGAIALGIWGILLALHMNSLSSTNPIPGYVKYVSTSSLIKYGLFPHLHILARGIAQNPLYLVLFLYGFFVAIHGLFGSSRRVLNIKILAFSLPLISVSFYAHSYEYFYVFLLAPASVLVALGALQLKRNMPHVFVALFPIMLVMALPRVYHNLKHSHDYQKQVNQIVHDVFPQPTAYIDRCSQISSYPKSGLFMSYIAMREYYEEKIDIIHQDIKKNQPKFILANIDSLVPDRDLNIRIDRQLLVMDQQAISQNYIHFWGGPIYIAGKQLNAMEQSSEFSILIAGTYTIDTHSPVTINGKSYGPGDLIDLKPGTHTLASPLPTNVTIRWGNRLEVPKEIPIGDEMFREF